MLAYLYITIFIKKKINKEIYLLPSEGVIIVKSTEKLAKIFQKTVQYTVKYNKKLDYALSTYVISSVFYMRKILFLKSSKHLMSGEKRRCH